MHGRPADMPSVPLVLCRKGLECSFPSCPLHYNNFFATQYVPVPTTVPLWNHVPYNTSCWILCHDIRPRCSQRPQPCQQKRMGAYAL